MTAVAPNRIGAIPALFARRVLRRVRRYDSRRMFWSATDERPNFGDMIGPYLYRALTGREPRRVLPRNRSLRTVTLTVGSILRWVQDDSIVWGSGIIARDDVFPEPHATHAVRGPLSRQRYVEMGYDCPEVYGDPAILLPRLYTPTIARSGGVLGVIPHYGDAWIAAERFGGQTAIEVIDVLQPVEQVVDRILRCDQVVSSSLHGIVVAQSYGIPAAWLRLSDRLVGDDVKFADYMMSTAIADWPSPTLPDRSIDAASLRRHVEEWPQPKLETLERMQTKLLATCPFLPNDTRLNGLNGPLP